MHVIKRDGSIEDLTVEKIHKVTDWACAGLNVSQSELEVDANLMFFDGIRTSDIHNALITAAATKIGRDAMDYTFVAARLLLQKLYKEVAGGIDYPPLAATIAAGIAEGQLNPALGTDFDLDALNAAIDKRRDLLLTYLSLQTLTDRYLIRSRQVDGEGVSPIIELPQHLWMRVAMGLALNETDKTARAIEFYNVLSQLEFVSSTPTLFNAGTNHSQLSSCYLNTIADTISAGPGEHPHASIFGTIEECANLSKYAGGIGTDWTRVRPQGDAIVGTNGQSSGVVPYLKLFNDTAVAVNQGGKRNGAFAAYLEPWHPDLYDFCDLKKNSGDERRRAHDIFPALWIPDLFMQRVKDGGVWSFFSPKTYPELHELHGDAFEARYIKLEQQGAYREQKPAQEVWKKILTSLFETGHPWITFKDECNRRNPQQHVGTIHGSNLCTEITLNTSDTETAVCNLGSVNLSRMRDFDQLRRVVRTGMRMLDNVIDINFYPSERAKTSNLNHRPVGMGVMGYTEWLVQRGIDWESQAHLEHVDALMERFSYYAIEASADLAVERGSYPSFKGSLWSRGILPAHTCSPAACDLTERPHEMDWPALARRVKRGMRNSNTMAIAPTATISNIAGTTATVEPIYEREYTEGNLSGSFLVVDPCLRYGRPELCKESFEIDQSWVIKAAAVRQKWLDQAQSTNIFVKVGIKGKQLADIYLLAWTLGLKTTYYLRTQSSQLAKRAKQAEAPAAAPADADGEVVLCSLDNPDCESCQ